MAAASRRQPPQLAVPCRRHIAPPDDAAGWYPAREVAAARNGLVPPRIEVATRVSAPAAPLLTILGAVMPNVSVG
jgi:hypothetical protein